jgi:hypothetical protein
MVDDHHRELDPVLGTEVDALAIQDLVDRMLEVRQATETDEVRALV